MIFFKKRTNLAGMSFIVLRKFKRTARLIGSVMKACLKKICHGIFPEVRVTIDTKRGSSFRIGEGESGSILSFYSLGAK